MGITSNSYSGPGHLNYLVMASIISHGSESGSMTRSRCSSWLSRFVLSLAIMNINLINYHANGLQYSIDYHEVKQQRYDLNLIDHQGHGVAVYEDNHYHVGQSQSESESQAQSQYEFLEPHQQDHHRLSVREGENHIQRGPSSKKAKNKKKSSSNKKKTKSGNSSSSVKSSKGGSGSSSKKSSKSNKNGSGKSNTNSKSSKDSESDDSDLNDQLDFYERSHALKFHLPCCLKTEFVFVYTFIDLLKYFILAAFLTYAIYWLILHGACCCWTNCQETTYYDKKLKKNIPLSKPFEDGQCWLYRWGTWYKSSWYHRRYWEMKYYDLDQPPNWKMKGPFDELSDSSSEGSDRKRRRRKGRDGGRRKNKRSPNKGRGKRTRRQDRRSPGDRPDAEISDSQLELQQPLQSLSENSSNDTLRLDSNSSQLPAPAQPNNDPIPPSSSPFRSHAFEGKSTHYTFVKANTRAVRNHTYVREMQLGLADDDIRVVNNLDPKKRNYKAFKGEKNTVEKLKENIKNDKVKIKVQGLGGTDLSTNYNEELGSKLGSQQALESELLEEVAEYQNLFDEIFGPKIN